MARKSRQLQKLAAAAAVACAGAWTQSSSAAVSYLYVTDQSSYTAVAGEQVTVQIFLKETLTGNSTSLIAADGGLYNAGFLVFGGGTSGSAVSIAAAGNSTNFPASGGAGGFNAFPYNQILGVNIVGGVEAQPQFVSGPVPVNGLISLGTVTITAGSTAGNSTQFNLGAVQNPFTGVVSGGDTTTQGASSPNNGLGYYDLDISESTPNPYTGVGSIQSPFTVNAIAPSANTNMYWKGAINGTWTTNNAGATNWRTDQSSNVDTAATPTSLSNVFLSANSAGNVTMALGADTAINSLSFTGNSSAVTIAGGNTITLNAAHSFIDASSNIDLAGIGLVVQAGAAAHTINANIALAANQTWQISNAASNPLTVGGTISGNGTSLTKTGGGTLALTGNNTYAGTFISAGTIRANNVSGSATGNGAVTVSGTGILGGNGTILNTGGNVTINSGGTITAGINATTTGKLVTNAQAWSGGGSYLWKTTGNGTAAGSSGANGSDLLGTSTIAVTAGSGTPFTIAISGASTLPVGAGGSVNTYTIAKATGGVTINGAPQTPAPGSPIILPTGGANAFALDTSAFTDNGIARPTSAFTLELIADPVQGSDFALVYSSTPEPGTAMLALGGMLPILAARRRKRRTV